MPRPGTYAAVLGALARVRRQREERNPILEGRPVNPEEEGDVDTVLRLSFTPPNASGHHAEYSSEVSSRVTLVCR